MQSWKMESAIPNVIFVTIFFSRCLLSSSDIISPRVYGGYPSFRAEIPYIVSIEKDNQQLCAGSILNHQFIVTVAHCVANRTDLKVYAGLIHSSRKYNFDVQVVGVQEVFVHPDYDYGLETIDNDVALLLLATNLTFNDVVQPIEIIKEDELSDAVYNRRSAIISGWGHSENYFRSKLLRTAHVVLLLDEECLEDIPSDCHAFKPEAHLCSGPLTWQQTGVGLHDDGGPLVVNNKLAGIILHGEHEDSNETCHESSIYARLPYYWGFFREYIILPDPYTEPTSYLDPCLLEIEITLELINATHDILSSFLSRSYLFDYNLWFFGSRNRETYDFEPITDVDEDTPDNETYSDVFDSENSTRYTTEEKTSQSTPPIFEEYQDEYETIVGRNSEEESKQLVNFEKLILNIQMWTTSPNAEGGIGFRLFPNSPVDSFILLSARTE